MASKKRRRKSSSRKRCKMVRIKGRSQRMCKVAGRWRFSKTRGRARRSGGSKRRCRTAKGRFKRC